MDTINIKEELQVQAEETTKPVKNTKKAGTIQDMIKAMMPEIKKALPSMISPERFTRIALSAVNNNPVLAQCTPMSFIAALMSSAQLGLEPNTPLGQAYLIPYKNKGTMEVQFQVGYKGLIDLAYRNGQIQTIQAESVREKDEFYYQFGLEPELVHRPAASDRGNLTFFYAVFRTVNGGYGMSVMSVDEIKKYAMKYSKGLDSKYSPWQTSFEEMSKKTVIKKALKYAPISTEFQRALSSDESIKNELSDDMFVVPNQFVEESDNNGYEEVMA